MKTSAETRPKHETLTNVYVHISERQISVDRHKSCPQQTVEGGIFKKWKKVHVVKSKFVIAECLQTWRPFSSDKF